MRELKFKIWDDELEKMFNPIDLYFGLNKLEDGQYLLQYTGLKDKNNKEIYEGDIVRIHTEDKTKIYTISFNVDEGLYDPYIEGSNEYFYTIHQLVHRHEAIIEIIGNIYEHPNLINQ